MTSAPEHTPTPYDDLPMWLQEQAIEDKRRAEYTRDHDGGGGPLNSIRTASSGHGFMEVHCTRLMADADATLRIIEMYRSASADSSPDPQWQHMQRAERSALLGVLRSLAEARADRPSYREEWRS